MGNSICRKPDKVTAIDLFSDDQSNRSYIKKKCLEADMSKYYISYFLFKFIIFSIFCNRNASRKNGFQFLTHK